MVRSVITSLIVKSEATFTYQGGLLPSDKDYHWQAALSIPSNKFAEEITAAAYVLSDAGEYHFCNERTFSVLSLASAYKNTQSIFDGLNDSQQKSVRFLSGLGE